MGGGNYKVYRHTTPSKKVYIGITQQQPAKRWQNGYGYVSNIVFHRAIEKYGWDNIEHEIVFDGLTVDEAKSIEIELIAKHRSTDRKYGYNVTSGGDSAVSRPHTDAEKQKRREAWTGAKNPNARSVICLETLAVYETATEARKATGATKVCECCKRAYKHRTSNGYHWAYYDKSLPMEYYSELLNRYIEEESRPMTMSDENKRKLMERCRVAVECIETGEVFKSLRDAARATGANPPNICNCCKGKKKTAGGFHWRYAGVNAYD